MTAIIRIIKCYVYGKKVIRVPKNLMLSLNLKTPIPLIKSNYVSFKYCLLSCNKISYVFVCFCSLSQYWYDQGKVPFALKTYIGLYSLKFSKVVSIGLKIGLQMVFISPKKWSSFGLQWRLLMVFKLVTISVPYSIR